MQSAAATYLDLAGITVSFGDTPVLGGVDLTVARGEFVALLGASGCGKTTLLRAIAGFQSVDAGSIRVGGRDVTSLGPEARGMAMVFQSYALWPHMTVRQNIEYGLKLRRLPATARAARYAEIEALLSLQGLEGRKPAALSGGQRQRVALGRALAIQPDILLLDEPLSNLDARIRLQLREDIRRLQQEIGITAIHVTHDREEAMVMADRVVVLNAGRIEQVGAPADLYEQPASAFVAAFMGAENHLALQAREGILHGPEGVAPLPTRETDGTVEARFRTAEATAHPEGRVPLPKPGMLVASGRVSGTSYLGGVWQVTLALPGGDRLSALSPEPLAVGTAAVLQVPAPKLFLFPANRRSSARLPAVLAAE